MPALVTNQAESTSVNEITGTTITLQEGDGDLFPIINNLFDYFYVRIGTDEDNVVVKIIDRTTDTLTAAEQYDVFPIDTPVKLTVCKELLDDYQPYFYRSGPVYVGTMEGAEFPSIGNFKDAFENVWIKPGQVIDVNIVGILDEPLYSSWFRTPQQMNITGLTTNIDITSVQSSSGTAGDYSVVLNVSSTTLVTTGLVLGVDATMVSGGTNPQFLYGAHVITNVDTGNSRITINSKNSGVPSGAVTGTVTVFRTVLSSINLGGNGLGFSGLGSIAIVSLRENYSPGVEVSYNANMNNIAIVAADVGIYLESNARLNASNCFISYCATGIMNSGYINLFESTVNACDIAMIQNDGSSHLMYLQCRSCAEGLQITNHSTCIIENTTISHTTGTAIHASRYAYVKATDTTLSSNGTDYSPALNTQGNKFGYIDDGT